MKTLPTNANADLPVNSHAKNLLLVFHHPKMAFGIHCILANLTVPMRVTYVRSTSNITVEVLADATLVFTDEESYLAISDLFRLIPQPKVVILTDQVQAHRTSKASESYCPASRLLPYLKTLWQCESFAS